MSTVRNELKEWTHEASEYTDKIGKSVAFMLKLGKEMGFNYQDIFYMILTEVHTQEMLDVLKN